MIFQIKWEIVAHIKPQGQSFKVDIPLMSGDYTLTAKDWPTAYQLAERKATYDFQEACAAHQSDWAEAPTSFRLVEAKDLTDTPHASHRSA